MNNSPAQVQVTEVASKNHVQLLLALIRELAHYENLPCRATEAALTRALSRQNASALLAWSGGQACAYVVYMECFNSIGGASYLWLDNLYVRPACRGRGIGRRLLLELSRRRHPGTQEIRWRCQTSNPSNDFYARLGAAKADTWHLYTQNLAALEQVCLHAGDPQSACNASACINEVIGK